MGDVDEELLAVALKRKDALAALAREPHHREDLEDALGYSKTTCHRIVRAFDESGLLRRTDSGYELTRLGEVVHEQVRAYVEGVGLALELEPLLETLAAAGVAVDLEYFTGATITTPEPGNPYPFTDRTMELFRESDTIRVIDCNPLVPPVYVEQMLDIALETGMRGEFVVTEDIAVATVEGYPDRQRQVAAAEDASGYYLVIEDIEFGLALYDDHLDVRIYDEATGTPVLYVDTDRPAAIEWAESVYADYRERARPATELEAFPEWGPNTPLAE